MVSTAIGIIIAVILIAATIFILLNLKKVLVNTALGVVALLAINYLGAGFGIKIPITIVTVLVSAILGLAGVGGLVLLKLLGIIIA